MRQYAKQRRKDDRAVRFGQAPPVQVLAPPHYHSPPYTCIKSPFCNGVLSHRVCQLIGFRESTHPQNRPPIVYRYQFCS